MEGDEREKMLGQDERNECSYEGRVLEKKQCHREKDDYILRMYVGLSPKENKTRARLEMNI